MFLSKLKMIFQSNFKNEMEKHLVSFVGWEKKYYKSDIVEKFVFKKELLTIDFAYDLREHRVNFKVYQPNKQLITIEFRTVGYADDSMKVQDLIMDMEKLKDEFSSEAEEINAYMNFLKINNLI